MNKLKFLIIYILLNFSFSLNAAPKLDDELFHYVMSRGIPRLEAEKLLIRGFFNEVLNKDKWESHREEIANKIKSRYEKSLESKV